MKTAEEILKVLNQINCDSFQRIISEFGHSVFTPKNDTSFDDISSEGYIEDENLYNTLKELNIEIIFDGRETLNPDSTQMILSIDNHLFGADGYYSSYDGDNYEGSDWYMAQEKEVTITTYTEKK